MALEVGGQLDYSCGMCPAFARHLIPENGLYDLINGLLDDNGSLYRRGGAQYLTAAGLGAAGLLWGWDGFLAGGARTMVASNAKWGVSDSTDTNIVDLGGSGLGQPKVAVEIGGILIVGGGVMYGGSRKAADYSGGTVATTNGSAAVVGTGTSWLTDVDIGMLFRIGTERYYVVSAVNSDTSLTLRDAYEGTTAGGKSYTASRLGSFPRASDIYAVVADRLVSCEGSRIVFSRGRSSGAAGLPPVGQLQFQTFDATDFHEVVEGLQITGARELRGNLIVFTTRGVFTVANMALALTSSSGSIQQRLERLDRDFVLWTNEGIASFGNALVVPGVNGCFLIDGITAPERLSRSIDPLWQSYARAGYRTGIGAVYRNHYVLPVLDGSNTVIDLLVCRLDRPVKTPFGTVYPWGHFNGAGANVGSFVVRSGAGLGSRQSKLLGFQRATASRILDCSSYFEPAAGVKTDQDATTHVLDVVTRDHQPANGALATVKKLRARYELSDAASDDPKITAYFSKGAKVQNTSQWGGFNWGAANWADSTLDEWTLIATQAPEDPGGRQPFVFRLTAESRKIRFRFQSSGPAAKLSLRGHEFDARLSRKR